MPVAPDAQKPLLQLAVAGELPAGAMRAMRPFTMMATRSAMAQATPIFCSITRTSMPPSSASVVSRASTCWTITGASPRSARP
jgi:hypothetical protein